MQHAEPSQATAVPPLDYYAPPVRASGRGRFIALFLTFTGIIGTVFWLGADWTAYITAADGTPRPYFDFTLAEQMAVSAFVGAAGGLLSIAGATVWVKVTAGRRSPNQTLRADPHSGHRSGVARRS